MIEQLQISTGEPDKENRPKLAAAIDDDWLNVFERYAEDATTERMQQLWGRVLAGEIRSPGKFAMRTLRFLSEFSQVDALSFSVFCDSAFGEAAPRSLILPPEMQDIREVVNLESAGLIQGASGIGFTRTLNFDDYGNSIIREGNLFLLFQGEPKSEFQDQVITLTPMGQELITLLPSRDPRAAARRVAHSVRSPMIRSAQLATVHSEGVTPAPLEALWESEEAAVVENAQ